MTGEPLQRLSTRKVYAATLRTSGRPTHRHDRWLSRSYGDDL